MKNGTKRSYAYKNRTDALIGSLKDGSEILYPLQLVTQGIEKKEIESEGKPFLCKSISQKILLQER